MCVHLSVNGLPEKQLNRFAYSFNTIVSYVGGQITFESGDLASKVKVIVTYNYFEYPNDKVR